MTGLQPPSDTGDDEPFTEDIESAEVLAGSGLLPTANASPGALPAGWALNEYRIESLLGSGFGLTYPAHDTLLDCKVAIKEFLPTCIAIRSDAPRALAAQAHAGLYIAGQHIAGQRVEIASCSQEVLELDSRSGITRRNDVAQPVLVPDAPAPLLEALLARVLVTRIAAQATSAPQLIEQLAAHIPNDAQRAGFLIEAKRHVAQTGATTSRSSQSMPGATVSGGMSAARSSLPPTGTSSRYVSSAPRPLDDAVIADIERRLARLIGPVTRTLVGRVLKRHLHRTGAAGRTGARHFRTGTARGVRRR
jgi:hypothetical protein